MTKVLNGGLLLFDVCLHGLALTGVTDYDVFPLSIAVTSLGLVPIINRLVDRIMHGNSEAFLS